MKIEFDNAVAMLRTEISVEPHKSGSADVKVRIPWSQLREMRDLGGKRAFLIIIDEDCESLDKEAK